MSGYRTHLLFYSACFIAASYYAPPGCDVITAYAAGGLFCLLPDVDCSKAKIRVWTILACLLLIAFSLLTHTLFWAALLAPLILILLLGFTRHRGILHTPSAGVVLSAAMLPGGPCLFASALIGYLSHLLLDGKLFG